MKETFRTKNFGPESREMIRAISEIMDAYEADGLDLSLRQLYYQLVVQNLVPNSERSYKNIGNLVSDARYAGLLDWDMIKDRGREMQHLSHWASPADIVRTAAQSFRIDRWADQPNYCELMVEKTALEGVLLPVCQEMHVPFTANRGYTSSSALYECSRRYIKAIEAGKEVHVVYLGDHDPSGIDMSRDVEERLDEFVKISMGREDEVGPNETPAVTMHRIALNMDQVRRYNPPENPAKITDSRAQGYIARFGRASWELDAIEPRRLAQLVRDAVAELLDTALWEASGQRQEQMREELTGFADNYGKDSSTKKRKKK